MSGSADFRGQPRELHQPDVLLWGNKDADFNISLPQFLHDLNENRLQSLPALRLTQLLPLPAGYPLRGICFLYHNLRCNPERLMIAVGNLVVDNAVTDAKNRHSERQGGWYRAVVRIAERVYQTDGVTTPFFLKKISISLLLVLTGFVRLLLII